MSSLGTVKDWTEVFAFAIVWGACTLAYSRYQLKSQRGTILSLFGSRVVAPKVSVRDWTASILLLALLSFDEGFWLTFKQRSFHDGLLVILLAVNLALIVALGFLPRAQAHSDSQ